MSESSVWNKLKAKGFSDTATAAIMGNMQAESAFIPNNVEDRYHTASWKTDEYYTSIVDNGMYSRDQFASDSYGYGLCQITYPSRKRALYNYAKQRGVSIADEQMQIDFLMVELTSDFRGVYDLLLSNASLYKMTEKYMKIFENPLDQSDGAVNVRVNNAQKILNKYSGTNPDVDPEPTPEPQPSPTPQPIDHCQTETPILKRGDKDFYKGGDKGVAVSMLQKGLEGYGYDLGTWGCDGDFGGDTEKAVKEFQKDSNLKVDGIVGEDTWQVIFQ